MHKMATVLVMLQTLVTVRVQTKISYVGKLWLSLVWKERRASDCECRMWCPNKECSCDLQKHSRTADNGGLPLYMLGGNWLSWT